jgi:transketolase
MLELSDKKIEELKSISKNIRKDILLSLNNAKSGHTAGSLGIVEILVYLYFYKMRHNPNEPKWHLRDRFILSAGHLCPALYTTLSYASYIDKADLNTLRKFGSKLQGHPHREFLPILETSSGPLGEGLSQAVGMAIVDKREKFEDKYFYCLCGDGELNEGQNWEAIMLAHKEKLNNLVLIIDKNNIQLDGFTKDIMPMDSLIKKIQSFNWSVEEVDGHDFTSIDRAFSKIKENKDTPIAIILNTIPGKGVSFFENNYKWHGKTPNDEELKLALKEIDGLN